MDHSAAIGKAAASLRAFLGVQGRSAPGSRTLDMDGVTAAIVPVAAERSVMNGVAYEDPDALVSSIDALARAYDDAGVLAWTVWVRPGDREVAAALERAGHVLDADPEAMWRPLDDARPPEGDPPAEWGRDVDPAEVMAVNDRAYGFEGTPWQTAFATLPRDGIHTYLARVGGEPASALMTYDHGDDCLLWAVATVPEARGRGLVRWLLAHALADARERGLAISTLEATKLGQPVYESVGYRGLGAFQMWERRRSAPK